MADASRQIISYNNMMAFDEDKGRAVATLMTVSKGDSITEYTVYLARLPLSSTLNLGTTIRSSKGRYVRGAIWEVRNGVTINDKPMWMSTNMVNTNLYQEYSLDTEASRFYNKVTFEFDGNQQFQTTQIFIGVVCVNSDGTYHTLSPTGNLCMYGYAGGSSQYTIDLTSTNNTYTYSKGIYIESLKSTHYGNTDNTSNSNPKLVINNIRSRTLSRRSINGTKDSPAATTDIWENGQPAIKISSTKTINNMSTQWNTNNINHPWHSYGGFDIKNDGFTGLMDKTHNTASLDSTTYVSNRTSPYWVFNRSRILFKFDKFEGSASSYIEYSINGKAPVSQLEGSDMTTLLICPKDEGVEDNSELRIKLTRKTKSGSRVIGSSNPMEIVFKTYVNPEVHIAYPKSFRNENGEEISNYVLRANEVLNNLYDDNGLDSVERICSALNILLTKDGGDDSGLPIFTRIYIAEYKGSYSGVDSTPYGKFDKPSNQDILEGNDKAILTASWRGVQLDDGSLIQLSGMRNKGFTWDDCADKDDATPRYHKIYIKDTDNTLKWVLDKRLYFRAGYKYLIKVRRFHSAAAGADTDYMYTMSGGDNFYPPDKFNYDEGRGNGGYISDFKGKANNLSDYLEYINTNINEADVPPNERWVGPADGTSGIKSTDTASNYTYPGFSKAEQVIIDCLDAIPSNSNLIISRPAVQEIGADHWLTFAYKHLNKNPAMVDDNVYSSTTQITLNSQGICESISPEPTVGLGNTWSGHSNTVQRIHDMYHLCVCRIIEAMKKEVAKLAPECAREDYTLDSGSITIKVNFQGFNPTSDDSKVNYLKIYEDPSFNANSTYDSSKASGVLGNDEYDENAFKSCIFYGTQNSYEGVYADDSHKIFGNQYMWFPIINATKNNGNTNIKTNKIGVKSNFNSLFDDSENFAIDKFYGGAIDTNHTINLTNTYQDKFDATSGISGVPEKWYEYNVSNGYLYTSKAQASTTSAGGEYGVGGDQMFSSKSTADNLEHQLLPGKLFLRVPATQDCENGTKTANRNAIPTRKDLAGKESLVRTNHYVWFKTHIFGSFTVEYTFVYKNHEITTQIIDGVTTESHNITNTETTKSGTYTNSDIGLGNIGLSGITLGDTSKTYNNILTVYGEDNSGLGRCLSADDYTSLWFDNENQPHGVNSTSNPVLDGSIEVPIKVRYTPLVQPIICNNTAIVGEVENRTVHTHSSVSLRNYKESASDPIRTDGTEGKDGFVTTFSYGMYRSAMGGNYYSFPTAIANTNAGTVTANSYQRLGCAIATTYTTEAQEYNTDIFPSVGICNAFTVLLIPSDAKNNGQQYDYTKMTSNWFSNRNNYQNITSSTDSSAKTVIVADVAKTEIYKYIGDSVTLDNSEIDHRLRTKFDCTFNYKNLLTKKSGAVTTSLTGDTYKNYKNRDNILKLKTWYDLVVIPVFTNNDGFKSDEHTKFNGDDFDFKYARDNSEYNGAGVIYNNTADSGTKFGGGTDDTVIYYGSTPLVVRKFLRIAENRTSGGGGGGGGGTDPDPTPAVVIPKPFNATHCILYPNINKVRYGDIIPEVPGFWLDNTFRIIIRGPHFRDNATINDYLAQATLNEKPADATEEVSLETATNGKLTGKSQCKDFKITDLMIHFGKYNDIPKQRYTDNDGTVKFKDFKTPELKDGVYSDTTFVEAPFNSDEFQTYLNQRSQDKEWLNSLGIYTMRTNPEAFSKCAPEVKAAGDTRDIITAGSYDATDIEEYSKRLVEFNPHLVDVHTPYTEGYYIQVRYLNSEYSTESSAGEWSEWESGVVDENATEDHIAGTYNLKTYAGENKVIKDDQDRIIGYEEYMVPCRDYNNIFTSFRSYIKDDYPGTALQAFDEKLRNMKPVIGAGTSSINIESPVNTENPENLEGRSFFIQGEGNLDGTSIVPDKDLDFPYPSMIGSKDVSDNYSEIDKFLIPEDEYNRHSAYWEIRYVDYVIRNMAKLYYGETNWMLYDKVANYQLKPEDLGWTLSMSYTYSQMNTLYPNKGWNGNEIDTIVAKGIKTQPTSNLTYNGKNVPFNNDRYFRKSINAKDYEDLLTVLKKITGFLRSSYFTGKVTSDTDILDDSGYGTGYSVLPISPELLEFTKLNDKRTVIGHSQYLNDAENGSTKFDKNNNLQNNAYKRVDCNYLLHIWTDVVNKICGR